MAQERIKKKTPNFREFDFIINADFEGLGDPEIWRQLPYPTSVVKEWKGTENSEMRKLRAVPSAAPKGWYSKPPSRTALKKRTPGEAYLELGHVS